MLERNKVHCGDARELSDKLEENSISCIITSPPYWALRHYGIPPSVWDGDALCDHDFVPYGHKVEMYSNDKRAHWQNEGVSRQTLPEAWKKVDLGYAFCSKCNAWLGTLGLEPDFNLYVKHLCDIFDKLKRPLRDDGTLWVNLGDTYYTKSGSAFHFDQIRGHPEGTTNIHMANAIRGQGLLPTKCLVLAPMRFVIEMVNRGWTCRNVIIWQKNNVIPNSAKDRFTVDFEYLFFFTQNRKYYFEKQIEPYQTPPKGRYRPHSYPEKTIMKNENSEFKTNVVGAGMHDGVRKRAEFFKHEGRNKRTVWDSENSWLIEYYTNLLNSLKSNVPTGTTPEARNKKTVWNINTKPCKEAHFAVFPPDLVKIPIEAGCPEFICEKCGKPRVKLYKNIQHEPVENYTGQSRKDYKGRDLQDPSDMKRRMLKGMAVERIYKGYSDCGCGVGFKPGVVLDPFSGTATTCRVARSLKRDWMAFDVSEEYCKIAEKLINKEIQWEKEDEGDDIGDMMLR